MLDSFHFEFEGDEEASGILVPESALSRRTMKPKNKKMSIEEKVEGRMLQEEEEVREGGGGKGGLFMKKTQVDKDGNDVMVEDEFEEEEETKESVPSYKGDGPEVIEGEGKVANDDKEGGDEEEEGEDEKEVEGSAPVNKSHSIARAVVNSIMPWVKVFLLKEEKDHKGNKSKTVRPMVALALTKLISRLHAPVVSEETKNNLFTSLVIRVVDTLRSRDSAARDAARNSLQQMVLTMGMSSLKGVIYELQHSLTEGYQRHVCNYTIRYLLTNVLSEYSPPEAPSFEVVSSGDGSGVGEYPEADATMMPLFDQCIPMVIISVLDDLNGVSETCLEYS